MDEAYKETEKILKDIERRINREYHQAEVELQEKIDDYFRRFKYKDETWQKWVREGSKTQRQYNDWRIGQMAIGRRWEEQKETIARDMAHANEVARKIVSQKMPDVYALNHNYGTYEVEHGSQIDTGYTMYDHDTVEGLFLDRKIYHDPGRTTLNKIAQGLEQRWNRQNVQSAMMQGILQGESIPKMASRLAETVGEKNRKAAIRNARTITTGVQNKGRIDSYDRANKMGIPTSKQWVATLDGRTRHTHREIDGEVVPEGELFSNGCEFPGDPGGAPEEIYNCRCSVIAAIKGFERDLSDLSNRRSEKLGDMTYDEWKNAKAESQDIAHGEKIGRKAKEDYLNAYKGLNRKGQRIEYDLKGKDSQYKDVKNIVDTLSGQYNTNLEKVIAGGANHAAGDVDITGATMRMNAKDIPSTIHEFAHTLANSLADKYHLSNNNEFWKEIKQIRKKYIKDVGGNTKRWISSYEHSNKSIDEFFAEAYTHAKSREMGIVIPEKYGSDYLYSQQVLDVTDKYFRKESGYSIIKADRVISGHDPSPKKAEPYTVIDHAGKDGKTETRTFYNDKGTKAKDITTHDHSNPKWHNYGQHGEHAHDYVWSKDDSSLITKTTRDLTDAERKMNADIL